MPMNLKARPTSSRDGSVRPTEDKKMGLDFYMVKWNFDNSDVSKLSLTRHFSFFVINTSELHFGKCFRNHLAQKRFLIALRGQIPFTSVTWISQKALIYEII